MNLWGPTPRIIWMAGDKIFSIYVLGMDIGKKLLILFGYGWILGGKVPNEKLFIVESFLCTNRNFRVSGDKNFGCDEYEYVARFATIVIYFVSVSILFFNVHLNLRIFFFLTLQICLYPCRVLTVDIKGFARPMIF